MDLRTTDDPYDENWRLVVYGPSGTGKSTVSGTAKNQLRVEFPIGEGDGGRSLAGLGIPTFYVTDYYQFVQTMWAIHGGEIEKNAGETPDVALPATLLTQIKKDPETKKMIDAVKKLAPETIVLDSWTATQNLHMKQSRAFWGRDVGQTHYGDVAKMAEFWIEFCIKQDFNFVFITQQTRISDDDVGLNFYVPMYPGKASHDIINPKMTFILPLEVRTDLKEWGKENRNRWFKTQADGRYLVKARTPGGVDLPDQVPANIEAFMKNIDKAAKAVAAKKKKAAAKGAKK